MKGESHLKTLIENLKPHLHEGEYVFCTASDESKLSHSRALATFREAEGLTMVLKREDADKWGLDYDYIAAWISLEVYSSLQAVGLTAAVSGVLAEAGISCNVIAAYHHDHLFVAKTEAHKAMEILNQLSKQTTIDK